MQVRDLRLVPVPHGTEQSLQPLHSLQLPSTEGEVSVTSYGHFINQIINLNSESDYCPVVFVGKVLLL